MNKVTTANGYDYYVGMEDGKPFYNIVPQGSPAPDGGYAREYICGIKKIPDMFDQPKKEVMKNKYVVVSKQAGPTSGRTVLVSFAAKPMWKSYEELRRQEQKIPECYDKKTALYALNKYGGKRDEIVLADTIVKELEQYKIDSPHWQ